MQLDSQSHDPNYVKNQSGRGDSRPMERNVNINYMYDGRNLGTSKVDTINLSTPNTLMPLERSRTLVIQEDTKGWLSKLTMLFNFSGHGSSCVIPSL